MSHLTIKIFEVHKTMGVTMPSQVKNLLYSFGLFDNIIA
jgi:phage-related holin